jgi:hypothetical protein
MEGYINWTCPYRSLVVVLSRTFKISVVQSEKSEHRMFAPGSKNAHNAEKEKALIASFTRLEMRGVESHQADQPGHETSSRQRDDPSHEDIHELLPVDSTKVKVHKGNTH